VPRPFQPRVLVALALAAAFALGAVLPGAFYLATLLKTGADPSTPVTLP